MARARSRRGPFRRTNPSSGKSLVIRLGGGRIPGSRRWRARVPAEGGPRPHRLFTRKLPDQVGLHARRLEVGPGQELGHHAGGDELKGGDDQDHPHQEQGPGPDVFSQPELHPGQVGQDQTPHASEAQADGSEEVPRTGPVTHEEVDREEVQQDPEGSADSVFRLARHPGPVVHHLLGDSFRGSGGGEPGRDEPVHLSVEPNGSPAPRLR